jgi:hypothetical protein
MTVGERQPERLWIGRASLARNDLLGIEQLSIYRLSRLEMSVIPACF